MKKACKFGVPAAIALTGAFFAVYSYIHYDLYSPTQGPLQGAVPMAIGILLFLTGLLALFQARSEAGPDLNFKNWTIIIAVILIITCSYLIGFIPSIIIFLFVWLKFIEKVSFPTTIVVIGIVMVFIIGVFVFWMDIPFTEGLLVETLFG